MNKRGFTLTELITVIAIIGLILLITIPVYTGVMNNNKEEKYKIYVETVEKAALTYADIELPSTVEAESVSLDDLKKYGYLKDSSDVNVDYNTSITITKVNNEVTITDTEGDELKLTFEDGTTCDKTKCW